MKIYIVDNNVFQDIVDCGSINLVPVQAFTDSKVAGMKLTEMIQEKFPTTSDDFMEYAEKQAAMNDWFLHPADYANEYYDDFIEMKYDELESECIYEIEVQ